MILTYGNGLRIDGVPFALDATRGNDFSYASHAHADHCGRHKKMLTTAATAALVRLRFGKRIFHTMAIGEPEEIDGVRVELFEAGHVLGSSQIRLTIGERRILFTGDLKPDGGRSTPPADVPTCDSLIIESTFGRPEYVFPPVAEVADNLCRLIKRAFVRGLTPVILAYALGKAQEVMALLADENFTFVCPRGVFDIVELYREAGVDLPRVELFDGEKLKDRVVVLPPGRGFRREWKFIKSPFTMFLSGWALDNSRRRSFADVILPLSDHADHRQLIDFIDATGASTVFTHHGFAELAGELQNKNRVGKHLIEGHSYDLVTGSRVSRSTTPDLFTDSNT